MADRFDELLLRVEVWRERPAVVSALVVMVAVIAGLGWWLGRPSSTEPVESLIPMADSGSVGTDVAGPIGAASASDQAPGGAAGTGAVAAEASPGVASHPGVPDSGTGSRPGEQVGRQLVVHVVGAVARPGLVSLAPGSRIADAVAAAGGVVAGAGVDRLNLAAPVADGMQIRVPEVDEEVVGDLVVGADPVGGSGPAQTGGPVNLNNATDDQLQALPGVGPATAAAIIAWRTEHGGFLTVEDLTSVPGIGPVKLTALRDLVTV